LDPGVSEKLRSRRALFLFAMSQQQSAHGHSENISPCHHCTAATHCRHPLLRCPTWASRGDCGASALPHTRGVGTMPLVCHGAGNRSFFFFFFFGKHRCHRDCCDQRHVASQLDLISQYLSPHTETRLHPGAVTCGIHITHACHLAADL